MDESKTLGQIAFEAHRDYLDGNRPWSDVREPERQLWEATGEAVAKAAWPAQFGAEEFATAGRIGAEMSHHSRWHVKRGESKPGCRYCEAEAEAAAPELPRP